MAGLREEIKSSGSKQNGSFVKLRNSQTNAMNCRSAGAVHCALSVMANYQSGPGVSNSFSNGMREVPDVAAQADTKIGYAIYTINPSSDKPGWPASCSC